MGIQIDGVHIIVSAEYAKMKKADAVKHMLKEGFLPGDTEAAKKKWAEAAYDLIKLKEKGPAEEVGPSLESSIQHPESGIWSGLGNFKTEQNK